MKILLDENVNKRLKQLLPDFDVRTDKEMNWLGKTNGELLSLAADNNFTVIISNDTNPKFQQNLNKYNLNFLVLRTKSNNLGNILPLITKLNETLHVIQSGNLSDNYFEIS